MLPLGLMLDGGLRIRSLHKIRDTAARVLPLEPINCETLDDYHISLIYRVSR